jgi:hypothetical protein
LLGPPTPAQADPSEDQLLNLKDYEFKGDPLEQTPPNGPNREPWHEIGIDSIAGAENRKKRILDFIRESIIALFLAEQTVELSALVSKGVRTFYCSVERDKARAMTDSAISSQIEM